MSARTLAFLPIMCLALASCASIGGAIDDTSAGVRGLVSSTGEKIGGLFNRDDEAKALKAAAVSANQPAEDPATVRTIQQLLVDAGYTPGPVDGVHGPKTREAIIAFQSKMELAPDGLISADLLGSLRESAKSKVAHLGPGDKFFAFAIGVQQ